MVRTLKVIGLVIAAWLGAVVVLVVGHWIFGGLLGGVVTLAAVLAYVVAVVVYAVRRSRR